MATVVTHLNVRIPRFRLAIFKAAALVTLPLPSRPRTWLCIGVILPWVMAGLRVSVK